MITMHAHPRQTDRQTDEHHGNSATIRSMNASRAKNLVVYTVTDVNKFEKMPLGRRWVTYRECVYLVMHSYDLDLELDPMTLLLDLDLDTSYQK